MYGRCKKCGKKLTDPESRLRGYGPECWEELVARIRVSMAEEEDRPIPGQMNLFDYIGEPEGKSKDGA